MRTESHIARRVFVMLGNYKSVQKHGQTIPQRPAQFEFKWLPLGRYFFALEGAEQRDHFLAQDFTTVAPRISEE